MRERELSRRRLGLLAVSALLLCTSFMTLCKRNLPPSVPVISGPSYLHAQYDSVWICAVATDPYGDSIYYQIDWGDGDTSGWSNLLPSGDTITFSHSYAIWGATYWVSARARDKNGSTSDWSAGCQVTVPRGPTVPPDAPDTIQGADSGLVNQYIRFTTSSTEPDGDSVYVEFVYDTTQANRNSGWLGLVPSGADVSDSTMYDTAGTYCVVAYAKDTKGAISDPSPVKILTITAPELRPD